ncbi:MAG: purine-nucleoside phosphorylase, partial [Ferruginibacter sp.]|nr:purine-nucleoside phosphorylase [Chitinophagaceae bacterium]
MNLTPGIIAETTSFLEKAGSNKPLAGIVMGTGLGGMATKIEHPVIIPYSSIPHFPQATVEFHKGNL